MQELTLSVIRGKHGELLFNLNAFMLTFAFDSTFLILCVFAGHSLLYVS